MGLGFHKLMYRTGRIIPYRAALGPELSRLSCSSVSHPSPLMCLLRDVLRAQVKGITQEFAYKYTPTSALILTQIFLVTPLKQGWLDRTLSYSNIFFITPSQYTTHQPIHSYALQSNYKLSYHRWTFYTFFTPRRPRPRSSYLVYRRRQSSLNTSSIL